MTILLIILGVLVLFWLLGADEPDLDDQNVADELNSRHTL